MEWRYKVHLDGSEESEWLPGEPDLRVYFPLLDFMKSQGISWMKFKTGNAGGIPGFWTIEIMPVYSDHDEYPDRHPCEHPGCENTVQFDDEPYCFTHSPDSGSSVLGYSYKATH